LIIDVDVMVMWVLEHYKEGCKFGSRLLLADYNRIGMTNSGAIDFLQLVTILIFALFNANFNTKV
jgi:hypothetical protein